MTSATQAAIPAEHAAHAEQASHGPAHIHAPEAGSTATLIHDHPLMPRMTQSFRFSPEAYLREVAPARTFCFEHEIEALRQAGLPA